MRHLNVQRRSWTFNKRARVTQVAIVGSNAMQLPVKFVLSDLFTNDNEQRGRSASSMIVMAALKTFHN